MRSSKAAGVLAKKRTKTEKGSAKKIECSMGDPEAVYEIIKGKLLRFRKTFEEKQPVALGEWSGLMKGSLTALEFETRWERVIRKLQKFGLERGPQELLLAYYGEISKTTAREIKKDWRSYPNPDGTETLRQCNCWEEARALAIEIEGGNAATRALTNPNFHIAPYAGGPTQVAYGDQQPKGEKGKGGKKGTGKGKDADGAQKPRGACFDMIANGTCSRGAECYYDHI